MKKQIIEKVHAWITKSALTSGIRVIDGEVDHERDRGSEMLRWGANGLFHKPDWHRTPEAALARAEFMRWEKLKSLDKSVAKIKAMTFKIPS